jgi:hypothetical protein
VKLPRPVAEAVKSTFPGAKVVRAEKEDEGGETVYEVKLRYKAGTLEATLTPKGRVVKVELKGGEDDEKGKKKGDDEDDDKKGKSGKGTGKKGEDKSSGFQGEQTGEHRDGDKKRQGKDDEDDKGKGKKKGDRD